MADPKPAGVTGNLTVQIKGRLASVRRTSGQNGPVFVHLVKLPAPDAYSSPATVLVRSSQRHGDQGDPFDQLCQVGGYARTYQAMDDETGRKVPVQTADNTLTVVG